MKLIVGLGNPGAEYQNTRHNLGFITIDYLADQLGAQFGKSKFFGLLAEARHQGEKLLLLKPQTFMNRSGQAVRAIVDFYKIPHEDILILFDDMDLPCGQLRLRQRGSAGGHNGIKDIIAQLGNDNQLSRCKIGINHPCTATPSITCWAASARRKSSCCVRQCRKRRPPPSAGWSVVSPPL